MSAPAASQLSHQDGAYALDLSQDQHAHMQPLETDQSLMAAFVSDNAVPGLAMQERQAAVNAQEAARILAQMSALVSRDQGASASSSTTEADAMEDSMHASILDRVLASFSADFPIEFLEDAQVKKLEYKRLNPEECIKSFRDGEINVYGRIIPPYGDADEQELSILNSQNQVLLIRCQRTASGSKILRYCCLSEHECNLFQEAYQADGSKKLYIYTNAPF